MLLALFLHKAGSVTFTVASLLYLFTKSDILTILIPTTAFGSVAAADYCLGSFVRRLLWVWVHLLQFCVSNQSLDIQEDAKNKPWRPIPSGGISLAGARRLRWILLALCVLVSAKCDNLTPALVLSLATVAHNELQLGSRWLARNTLNAVGYSAFNIGAASVRCHHSGSGIPLTVPALNALIILTTIQAQDFKDVEGDALVGRHTLPLEYPRGSRLLTAAVIPFWSLVASRVWRAGAALSAAVVALGLATGAAFLFSRTREGDRRAYVVYNVWLCLLHVGPLM